MLERIIGVFKLDRQVYSEIEHDTTATTQAAIVVALVAALSAVGVILGALAGVAFGGDGRAIGAILGGAVLNVVLTFVRAFLNWGILAVVVYIVGTKVFHGEADLGEILRVTGFAQAPMLLAIVPCVGAVIGLLWMWITSFIGIQEGLDLETGQTVGVVIIAVLLMLVLSGIIGMIVPGGGLSMLQNLG